MLRIIFFFFFFFFNDTATTEIYTLSLHDALPIFLRSLKVRKERVKSILQIFQSSLISTLVRLGSLSDRKSTRLNSSHVRISYAVFCLKKKKKHIQSNHVNQHIIRAHDSVRE